MNDVMVKFGPMLTTEHAQLKANLLQELIGTRAGIRKRAIACLGEVSSHPFLFFCMHAVSFPET